MEILFLNHNPIWKSAFHRCFQLGKPLVRKGHKVTILTNAEKEKWGWKTSEIEGVRVVESPDLFSGPLRTGWDPLNVIRRMGWAREEISLRSQKKDEIIIHAFDTRPTVIHPALELKRKLGCPLVIDWGDWWGWGGAVRLRKPFWMNFLFEPFEVFYEESFKFEADWITCISEPIRQRTCELGFPRDRITVVRNPSELVPMDREGCRRELGLRPDTFYLIFSGFVLYDVQMVLDIARLLADRVPGKAGLIITGSVLRSAWDESKLHFIQPGIVSRNKLNQYMSAADLALMPLQDHLANRARLPGKVGDYLAAGAPILMNPVGDVADYDASQMAEVVVGLISDRSQLRAMSERGRKLADEKFNPEVEAEKLLKIYQTLTKLSPKS
jgi:glycosyltransferase involved in cell wall biosynthesis